MSLYYFIRVSHGYLLTSAWHGFAGIETSQLAIGSARSVEQDSGQMNLTLLKLLQCQRLAFVDLVLA